MMLGEYIKETELLVERFEKGATESTLEPIEAYRLYDVIEFRESEIFMFRQMGFRDEEELPKPSNKLIFPSFETKSG